MPVQYIPTTPHYVFITFKTYRDIPFVQNPFVRELGKEILVDVCGAMRIREDVCIVDWNNAKKEATIALRYKGPAWAEKAAARARHIREATVTVIEANE